MINGNVVDCVLRLKVLNPPNEFNTAMLDPVLYRTITVPHYKTGTLFKIYPTYDFACPIIDSIEDVTHVFRSNEYVERKEQTEYILTKLGMRIPKIYHYGRVNIDGAELSKRKIKESIKNGEYFGWDDVRLFTFRGLIKRGITIEALENFMIQLGYNETNITIDPQLLFTINKKIIDKISSRIMVIDSLHKVEIQLGVDDSLKYNLPIIKDVCKFIKNPSLGTKQIILTSSIYISDIDYNSLINDEEVTLMNIGNVIFHNGQFITHFDGSPKKTSKKLLWLSNIDNPHKINIQKIINNQIMNECYFVDNVDYILGDDMYQFYKMKYYKKIACDTFIEIC
jgi:glutamyl-tRNA synthetase